MAGTIIRTISLLKDALDQLSVTMALRDIERIGLMVNKAMSAEARSFHTSEHIFNLADENSPIQTLAALFHDIVYFHIDNGFTDEIGAMLAPYIDLKPGGVSLKRSVPKGDETLAINLGVFGFRRGDELPPFGGMNEFLSSVVMAKVLSESVDRSSIFKVAACIEATIPFRRRDESGKDPAEILFERLTQLNAERNIGLNESSLVQAVQTAVVFANRDVENFAEDSVARFLDNTWKLLPETNPSLRFTGVFTAVNYRIALQKMEGFLGFLDPETIFSSFRAVPSRETYADLTDRATRNVLAARDYLGIKLVTTGVLEAIATISGGDAPIALFMGEVADQEEISRFERMLPQNTNTGDSSDVVHKLLAQGRGSSSDFDLKSSPLANFFYSNLAKDSYVEQLRNAKSMFNGEMGAEDLLNGLPNDIIIPVIRACSEMAFTRRELLSAYVKKRES